MSLAYVLPKKGVSAALDAALEFHGDTYFSVSPASTGDTQRATISLWVRRSRWGSTNDGLVSAGNGSTGLQLYFDTSNRINVYLITGGGLDLHFISTATFGDNTWRHFVVQFDLNNGTPGNRMKTYVDNDEITVWTTSTNNTTDADVHHLFTSGKAGYIGGLFTGSLFNGILADVNLVSGQLVAPTEFGQDVDSNWVWKDYAGTHGSEGTRLEWDPANGVGKNTRVV